MVDNDTLQFLAFLDLTCDCRGYRNESYQILFHHLTEQENDFGYIKAKYLSISWKYWGSRSGLFLMEVTQQLFLILVLLVLIPCFGVSFALENDIFLRFTRTISWIIVSFQPTFLIKDKRCLLIQKISMLTKMC